MSETEVPLVVDLDGTLLRSDMLVESGFAYLRQRPGRLLDPLFWLTSGKAHLKEQLALQTTVDVAHLPYQPQVLERLRQEQAAGRRIILATASHRIHADAIAAHLGLFERVLATEQGCNLSARAKRDALVAEFGEKGFDYLGNAKDDLHVWASARHALLADPEFGVEGAARKLGNVTEVMTSDRNPMRVWAKQLRVHQWAKNALVFVPLLAAHKLDDPTLILAGLLAFLFFGLCASSVYLLNDLLDLEDDRQHKSKRYRPLASGMAPIKTALLLMPMLLLASFAGALLFLPWTFALVLACYYLLTLGYSLHLKRVMTVDVITLALLYTVRIIAGTFAFDVQLTFWMLAFSMFLFLSLALVKRYAELRESRSQGHTSMTRGRGYFPQDLEMVASLGAAAGYLAVMVLALYIQDGSTQAMYRHPQVIWLACPLLLYWVTRIWMIAHRGWMHDDPVVFALKDRNSLILFALFGMVFLAAT